MSTSVLYELGRKHGAFAFYYENGVLHRTGTFSSDMLTGIGSEYYETGTLRRRGFYKNSRVGEWTAYHPNGAIAWTGFYTDDDDARRGLSWDEEELDGGKRCGIWQFYDEDGHLIRTTDYSSPRR
ncbi:MAG: hypothetical protein IT464_02875 [Planctomycetes bacterium]|nr:hypothetical protein [Planctomycetota bacterium]